MHSVHVCFGVPAVIVSILPKIEGGNPARRSRPLAELNERDAERLGDDGKCRREPLYRKRRYSSARENCHNPFPIGGSPEGLSGPLMTGGCAGGGSAFGIRFAMLGTRRRLGP